MNNTISTQYFPINNFEGIKQQVLNWLQRFSTFSFLDNNQYPGRDTGAECLVAAGIRRDISPTTPYLNALEQLIHQQPGWLFGHVAYDLKNEIEGLQSMHADSVGFADCYFFEPQVVLQIWPDRMGITAARPDLVYGEIRETAARNNLEVLQGIATEKRFSKEEYLEVIRRLQDHILRGDCYEINFCQEFFATQVRLKPADIFRNLNKVSPNPFSAFYRVEDQWLICASPERFLKKKGPTILSQPIKGTARRDRSDEVEDDRRRNELAESAKDRSENVMVVDLVRNDLSKICNEGTVGVDELYGIYSFPQVHQMISTVSGTLRQDVGFTDILRATFPMGSMTGAPKRRVMELIEKYERTRRGLFAGAVGYITPGGDFDFNVVIRSILYNQATGYLSYQVGSGITFYSDAEREWEECLLKAEAIKTVLAGSL